MPSFASLQKRILAQFNAVVAGKIYSDLFALANHRANDIPGRHIICFRIDYNNLLLPYINAVILSWRNLADQSHSDRLFLELKRILRFGSSLDVAKMSLIIDYSSAIVFRRARRGSDSC